MGLSVCVTRKASEKITVEVCGYSVESERVQGYHTSRKSEDNERAFVGISGPQKKFLLSNNHSLITLKKHTLFGFAWYLSKGSTNDKH